MPSLSISPIPSSVSKIPSLSSSKSILSGIPSSSLSDNNDTIPTFEIADGSHTYAELFTTTLKL